MKAAVVTRYGPPEVVRIADLPMPQPGPGEVLIRIHASTVASGDWRLRSGTAPRGFGLIIRLAFGLRGPRQPVLGTELSGIVEATGPGVTRFAPGDAVLAFCGVTMRCHAEYRVVKADAAIVAKPATLSHAQAAALSFGGTTALHYLRDKARLQAGERLLVIGASGAVGSAAVQLGRYLGAEVSTLTSAANTALMRQIGADRTLDYTSDDYTAEAARYDVIMDCVGATRFRRALPALAPAGRFLMVAGDLPQMLGALRPGPQGKRCLGGPAPERAADVALLADLAAQGACVPLIDSSYPFDQIAQAHARVETGRKRGNVVVTMV
ncbi:MAG: NAD(P)-dependent alcohol dehydrogenase [Rhodobacterales bacterium]|nr:NAD(P)-dependent alcohol dehydrogenase [Rhodobacterales bacterium]NCT13172.1 NAD(P)-dependent alcohol dehydrogenase [Rhodobacterales bacterium]